MSIHVANWYRTLPALVAFLAVSACVVQPPQRSPPSGPPEPPVDTRPLPPPDVPVEPTPVPVPAPVIAEPVLSAASSALVVTAQAQLKAKNYPVAASSIERALRIEPGNPLLWIELGKVRYAEGNHVQAENMGRKAVSLSKAPQASSTAWRLIADSLRARGKTREAQEAMLKAESFR
jgi:hypothetical protein